MALALTALMTTAAVVTGEQGSAIPAGLAGLFAGTVHLAAISALKPSLVPPFEGIVGRWMVGLGLRFGAVAMVAIALAALPDLFPVLPTALGFLGVLIPLLFTEMAMLWRAMSRRP